MKEENRKQNKKRKKQTKRWRPVKRHFSCARAPPSFLFFISSLVNFFMQGGVETGAPCDTRDSAPAVECLAALFSLLPVFTETFSSAKSPGSSVANHYP